MHEKSHDGGKQVTRSPILVRRRWRLRLQRPRSHRDVIYNQTVTSRGRKSRQNTRQNGARPGNIHNTQTCQLLIIIVISLCRSIVECCQLGCFFVCILFIFYYNNIAFCFTLIRSRERRVACIGGAVWLVTSTSGLLALRLPGTPGLPSYVTLPWVGGWLVGWLVGWEVKLVGWLVDG